MTDGTSLRYCGAKAFPDISDQPPVLAVVVDTEEEFDWDKPFDRQARSVTATTANAKVHEIYDRFGISPNNDNWFEP